MTKRLTEVDEQFHPVKHELFGLSSGTSVQGKIKKLSSVYSVHLVVQSIFPIEIQLN